MTATWPPGKKLPVSTPRNALPWKATGHSGLGWWTVCVPYVNVFHEMRNNAISGTELVRAVGAEIERRLPPRWELLVILHPGPQVDAVIELVGPGKVCGSLAVEAKDVLEPRMVDAALARVGRAGLGGSVLVAPYIGPEARERIARAGCGYADATGNMRITLEKPALFIEATGADKNPWREDRPLASLKGAAAGAVVRAVCDTLPPYGVRELVQRANLSLGTVARVLDVLDRDALLDRDDRGVVVAVDWAAVIRRWARDYECLKANVTRSYLDPRGLAALAPKVAASSVRHAVTGSMAAARHAPIAPSRLATIYVEDAGAAAEAWGLQRVDTGGNVLLVEPRSPVVFERTEVADGLTYAAPSQIAADLLTAPGRGPAEADALLAWMGEHEVAWRT